MTLTPQRLFRFDEVRLRQAGALVAAARATRPGKLCSVLFHEWPPGAVVTEVRVSDTIVWEGEHSAGLEVFFPQVVVNTGHDVRVLVEGKIEGRLCGVGMGLLGDLFFPTHNRTFGAALETCRDGAHVARRGWNGKGMYLDYRPSALGGCLAYIEMTLSSGEVIPWTASQADLLASDWYIVQNAKGDD